MRLALQANPEQVHRLNSTLWPGVARECSRAARAQASPWPAPPAAALTGRRQLPRLLSPAAWWSFAAALQASAGLSFRIPAHAPAACRPDGLVEGGWATLRGKRPLNEDTVYCQFHPIQQNGEGQEQHVGCFGVFDG